MIYDDSYRDFDPYDLVEYDDHDFSNPACICPETFGKLPEFCPACQTWTDDVEIAMAAADGFTGDVHPTLAEDPAFYARLRELHAMRKSPAHAASLKGVA